jgi:hypothetical protein
LDDAFSCATAEDDVLFELVVTKAWLRQVIVALALICRGSYRGVIEFMRGRLKFGGGGAREVFSRLIFQREWTRGLGCKVGENRD